MIKQLLITLAVAAIVVVIARMKRARHERIGANSKPEQARRGLSTTEWVGYALAALMIITAATLGWLDYRERNEIIEVVVVDSNNGERAVYNVRRKALGDREFRTVDGLFVSLGASDRMERIE